MTTKHFEKLPGKNVLEEMRLRWIDAAFANGRIERIIEICKCNGTHFEINYRSGTFLKVEHQNIIIKYHRWADAFSPLIQDWKYTIYLTVDHIGENKRYVDLAYVDPQVLNPHDYKRHHFYVPGAWEILVDDLYKTAARTNEKEYKEKDLDQRKKLAEMLHITYDTE